jgi:transposase
VVDHLAGARPALLVAPPRCCLLATNELDAHRFPPQALLAGSQGPQHAERGVRFLKDPGLWAAALDRKKPERMMALLMVMTVCWRVYAVLEYRLRKALKDHEATFPNQTGQPVQHPTARWVFPSCVGIHLLRSRGEGAFVLNLNDQHQHLLRLLGRPYEACYS